MSLIPATFLRTSFFAERAWSACDTEVPPRPRGKTKLTNNPRGNAVTDTFLKMLHSGAVDAHKLTDGDRRALLELLKKSLNTGGGGEVRCG
jgi:hypothetical protein